MSKTVEDSSPSVSIVTALHNQLDRTKEFLGSLEASLPELKDVLGEAALEVILVDDASADGTSSFVDELSYPYRVLRNEENKGYAFSNNSGASTAKGEILVFLNNDLVLQSGWFQPMYDCLLSREQVGCVGNLQIDASTGRIDHAGIYFEKDGSIRHRRKGCRTMFNQSIFQVRALTGACFMTQKKTFLDEGGFDESFMNGFEDVDLCLRLGQRGYRHYLCPASRVLHWVGSSRGPNDSGSANRQRFHDRWGREELFKPRDWGRAYLGRFLGRPWRLHPIRAIRALSYLPRAD